MHECLTNTGASLQAISGHGQAWNEYAGIIMSL